MRFVVHFFLSKYQSKKPKRLKPKVLIFLVYNQISQWHYYQIKPSPFKVMPKKYHIVDF